MIVKRLLAALVAAGLIVGALAIRRDLLGGGDDADAPIAWVTFAPSSSSS